MSKHRHLTSEEAESIVEQLDDLDSAIEDNMPCRDFYTLEHDGVCVDELREWRAVIDMCDALLVLANCVRTRMLAIAEAADDE
jgi:hypothetical protein